MSPIQRRVQHQQKVEPNTNISKKSPTTTTTRRAQQEQQQQQQQQQSSNFDARALRSCASLVCFARTFRQLTARLAQSAERRSPKLVVVGSSPMVGAFLLAMESLEQQTTSSTTNLVSLCSGPKAYRVGHLLTMSM